jgi:hypothetical protein
VNGEWADLPILDGFHVYALHGTENEHVPLYVGQSASVISRIGGHLADPRKRSQIARVSVRPCPSQTAMDNTEQALILAFCPPWNRDGLPIAMRQADWSHGGRQRHDAAAWRRYLATDWLTTEQVAERLDCTVKDVNRLVDDGSLRRSGDGRRRFRPVWVADLLIARCDLLPRPHLFPPYTPTLPNGDRRRAAPRLSLVPAPAVDHVDIAS